MNKHNRIQTSNTKVKSTASVTSHQTTYSNYISFTSRNLTRHHDVVLHRENCCLIISVGSGLAREIRASLEWSIFLEENYHSQGKWQKVTSWPASIIGCNIRGQDQIWMISMESVLQALHWKDGCKLEKPNSISTWFWKPPCWHLIENSCTSHDQIFKSCVNAEPRWTRIKPTWKYYYKVESFLPNFRTWLGLHLKTRPRDMLLEGKGNL